MLRFAKFLTLIGLAMLPVAVAAGAYWAPNHAEYGGSIFVAYLIAALLAFSYWIFEDLEDRTVAAIFSAFLIVGPFVIGTGQLISFIASPDHASDARASRLI